ncbi:MAG: 5'-deoxynucleotidase [Firmicutes bacterium]|nr:5'-deoxynucleotidase [Bacillota bacterium]
MYNFFAYLSRMKLIRRWSLMRSVQPENIQEHSHQVAVIAHALAEIDNLRFGASHNCGEVVLLALYHDVGEVIIGDLPTPVKYFNPEIKGSYGKIENIAKEKLLSMLPADLRAVYRPYVSADEMQPEYRLVKAADKLSAYLKCLEELTVGNGEFRLAEKTIAEDLKQYMDMPAVCWFWEECVPAFRQTLDELG